MTVGNNLSTIIRIDRRACLCCSSPFMTESFRFILICALNGIRLICRSMAGHLKHSAYCALGIRSTARFEVQFALRFSTTIWHYDSTLRFSRLCRLASCRSNVYAISSDLSAAIKQLLCLRFRN